LENPISNKVPKEFDLNQGIDGGHWGMSALPPKADIARAVFTNKPA
jgi:hypothetical protein